MPIYKEKYKTINTVTVASRVFTVYLRFVFGFVCTTSSSMLTAYTQYLKNVFKALNVSSFYYKIKLYKN